MKDHLFVQPGRSVILEALLESEPIILTETPACPVCGMVVDLEALEHSIRSKPLRPKEGEPPRFILTCSMPCFKETCPVYLKLEVTISEQELEDWRKNPNCRLDHTYFRKRLPVTLEAKAKETLSAEPPDQCPVCSKDIDLAALIPTSKILFSGMPLPRPDGPPQYRATSYSLCPHCEAHLSASCFVSVQEVEAFKAEPETQDDDR